MLNLLKFIMDLCEIFMTFRTALSFFLPFYRDNQIKNDMYFFWCKTRNSKSENFDEYDRLDIFRHTLLHLVC